MPPPECGSVGFYVDLFSRVGFPALVAGYLLWKVDTRLAAIQAALERWAAVVGRREGDNSRAP